MFFFCFCPASMASNDCFTSCQQSNFPPWISCFISNRLPVRSPPVSNFSPSTHWCKHGKCFRGEARGCFSALSEKSLFSTLLCIRFPPWKSIETKDQKAGQPEISFAQQTQTAVGQKLSGCNNRSEHACECMCALMSAASHLCWVNCGVCARKYLRSALMKGSTACSAGCFFSPSAFLLPYVGRLVTMSGGERAAEAKQHHSSHMSNS